VLFHGVGGQHDQQHRRGAGGGFALADQAGGGQAVHDRHLHVHQDGVEGPGL
jgi:hypothetical protein